MPSEPSVRQRSASIMLIAIVMIACAYGLYHYWSRPPQMGASDEVFHAVDALYTAVRNRDTQRVNDCEQRLRTYREAGKLPPAAGDALDAIIRQTRNDAWQPAAERLYAFMLAQRRDR